MLSAWVCPEQLFRNPTQPFLRKPQTQQQSQKFPKNEKHLSFPQENLGKWREEQTRRRGRGNSWESRPASAECPLNEAIPDRGYRENKSALQGKLEQFTQGSCFEDSQTYFIQYLIHKEKNPFITCILTYSQEYPFLSVISCFALVARKVLVTHHCVILVTYFIHSFLTFPKGFS